MLGEFFKEQEFACRCGCGRLVADPVFIEKLNEVRRRLGSPLVLSSGYRCPEWNAKVSESGKNGAHTEGCAADMLVFGGRALEVVRIALELGFDRIGLKQSGPYDQRFIHLDTSKRLVHPALWTY